MWAANSGAPTALHPEKLININKRIKKLVLLEKSVYCIFVNLFSTAVVRYLRLFPKNS